MPGRDEIGPIDSIVNVADFQQIQQNRMVEWSNGDCECQKCCESIPQVAEITLIGNTVSIKGGIS